MFFAQSLQRSTSVWTTLGYKCFFFGLELKIFQFKREFSESRFECHLPPVAPFFWLQRIESDRSDTRLPCRTDSQSCRRTASYWPSASNWSDQVKILAQICSLVSNKITVFSIADPLLCIASLFAIQSNRKYTIQYRMTAVADGRRRRLPSSTWRICSTASTSSQTAWPMWTEYRLVYLIVFIFVIYDFLLFLILDLINIPFNKRYYFAHTVGY